MNSIELREKKERVKKIKLKIRKEEQKRILAILKPIAPYTKFKSYKRAILNTCDECGASVYYTRWMDEDHLLCDKCVSEGK